jgi:hypothetical protein
MLTGPVEKERKQFALYFSSRHTEDNRKKKLRKRLTYYSSVRCAHISYINKKTNMILFTLVILLLFLTVLCYYIKRAYFTLHGPIPGIPPQFLFGNLLQTGVIRQNVPFNLIFLDLKEKFGDIFQYWLGPTRLILVNRLEDVQHIFGHRQIYDQGDIFRDKFSLVNPYAIPCMTGLNIFISLSLIF